MIKQLKLKNYILIDDLTIDFANGLNIITGETGAGKSLLVNAIDLIFAPRISKEVIKTGEEKAVIELTIQNSSSEIKTFFEENDIDFWDNEIIISKEITNSSVRSRINGTLVSSEILKQLRPLFVDIHSQNQTYSYLQPKYHIMLLDSYGEKTYGTQLNEYKTCYKNYLDLCSELEKLKQANNLEQNQIEFLQFQVNEIETVQIKSANEDEELSKELSVLENSEKLKELTAGSYWALNGDDNSVLDALNKIKADISKAQSLDENLSDIQTAFVEVLENLKEVSSELNSYCGNLENDTSRLNEIQERLYVLDKLKHKYGGTLENVLKSYEEFTQTLSQVNLSTENITKLEEQISKVKTDLMNKAEVISGYRINLAQELSNLIQEKLTHLELPKSRFEIRVARNNDFNQDGIDNVEFMISTNISETVKPLAKVASGGETSRVMLAIKSVFANNDNIDTVIFDEIDSGISGRASQSVADELTLLAKTHQIIVITHQAIIASKADRHFYVKKSQNDVTKVKVYTLSPDEHIQALAELASGEITKESIEFAQSLMKL